MKKHILVIEDDPDISQLLNINLSDGNHDVERCDNGKRGLSLAMEGRYDVIILDLMLPEVDGLDICRQLRSAGKNTPILMLTARSSEADRVVGLEMGADDYLTKPFSVRELQARVKALLRRVQMMQQASAESPIDILDYDALQINIAKRQVNLNEQELELTGKEFDLLVYMARQPGLVFSRAQLLDSVWGYKHSGYEHTVSSHINRLRNKLESDPAKPKYVLTVWGVGYKFSNG